MEPALHVGDSHPVYSASSFKVNEIVAFYPPKKFSEDEKTLWVHRLVGSPGDILEMKNGKLERNRRAYQHEVEVKHGYIVNASMALNKRWLQKFEHSMLAAGKYQFFATAEELKFISKNPAVKLIESMIYPDTVHNEQNFLVVPGNNRDNWGPLQIPRQGDRVTITAQNSRLFARILGVEEKDLLPGQMHTVPVDCYFVLGDNRHNALDSRYLGFIPGTDMRGVMDVHSK